MLDLNKYSELVGLEMSILELSNELQSLDCEDICNFGNLREIIEGGDVVVTTDINNDEICGLEHIQVYFTVTIEASDDEDIIATQVKIDKIEEF